MRTLLVICVLVGFGVANADELSDLKARVALLERENTLLKAQMARLDAKVDALIRQGQPQTCQPGYPGYQTVPQGGVVVLPMVTTDQQPQRTRAQYTVTLKDWTQMPVVTYEQKVVVDDWNRTSKKYYLFYLENGTRKMVAIDKVRTIDPIARKED